MVVTSITEIKVVSFSSSYLFLFSGGLSNFELDASSSVL